MENYTISGTCSNCGECCSDILHLNSEEIKVIDEYLKTHEVKRHNIESNNFNCPFRNEELRKCDIYEVRPLICQRFKCDLDPIKAFEKRDLINANRYPISMCEVFFRDKRKSKIVLASGLKLFTRKEIMK